MSANGCFPNIITATPPLLGWHRNHTVTSLETPANYCHFHLRCFIRCAASTHPITDHLLLSHSDSDSGSDWSLSPSPNTNPNPNPNPNSADSGSKGLTAGFTRLKAKRVKALVKKIKQEEKSIGDDNNDDNRGVSEGGSYPKNAEPEPIFTRPKLNPSLNPPQKRENQSSIQPSALAATHQHCTTALYACTCPTYISSRPNQQRCAGGIVCFVLSKAEAEYREFNTCEAKYRQCCLGLK